MEKRFYDILTIAYFILAIGSMVVFYSFILPQMVNTGSFEDALAKTIQYNQIQKVVLYGLGFIYWLFILLLAIRLKVSTTLLVLIIIFVPFAPFYYLFSLRKKLTLANTSPLTQ